MNIEAKSRSAQALAGIDAATAPIDVVEALTRFLYPYGFRHFLLAELPLPPDGPWQRTVVFDGWPAEWSEHYAIHDHFSHDPCVQRCREGGEPFLWRELPRDQMSPKQLRVMDDAKEFGMYDGFCAPIHLPLERPAVITVAGIGIELDTQDIPVLEMVCIHAFRTLQRSRAPYLRVAERGLTKREREILTWIAAGKSAEDVSCILTISKFTVERHLSNIREKLDAINTVHAVVEAMRRHEIHP